MSTRIPLPGAAARAAALALALALAGCGDAPQRIAVTRVVPCGEDAAQVELAGAPPGPVALEVRPDAGVVRVMRVAAPLTLTGLATGATVTLRALDGAGRPAGPLHTFRHDPELIGDVHVERAGAGLRVTFRTAVPADGQLEIARGKNISTFSEKTKGGLAHEVHVPEPQLPISLGASVVIAPLGGGPAQTLPLPSGARFELAAAEIAWLAPQLAKLRAQLMSGSAPSAGVFDRLNPLTDTAQGGVPEDLRALDALLDTLVKALPPRWLIAELHKLTGARADPEVPFAVRERLAAIDADLELFGAVLAARHLGREAPERDALSTCASAPHGDAFRVPAPVRGVPPGMDIGLFALQDQLDEALVAGRDGVTRMLVATAELDPGAVDPLWDVELCGVFSMRATAAVEVVVNGHRVGTFRSPGGFIHRKELYLSIDPRVLVRGVNTVELKVRPLPAALEHREPERGVGIAGPGLELLWRM